MRNIRNFILALLILPYLLSSCDMFPEDCGAKGYLRATVSENGVSPSAPEALQVRYYDNYSGEEHTEKMGEPDYFAADGIFLSKIQVGEYRFLAYSRFNNKVRDVEDIATITIYSDTVRSDKYATTVISTEQNFVCMASDNGVIWPEDTTACAFRLTAMVQKIVFNVTLEGLSKDHSLTSLEAMLSGVITGRKIYTNQPISEYAGLIFNFTQTDVNKFTSEAYVFGVSNAIRNELKFECVGESFHQYSTVDLSNVLKDFTAAGMVIDLVIKIGEDMNMDNIYINNWEDMPQDDIEFGK